MDVEYISARLSWYFYGWYLKMMAISEMEKKAVPSDRNYNVIKLYHCSTC